MDSGRKDGESAGACLPPEPETGGAGPRPAAEKGMEMEPGTGFAPGFGGRPAAAYCNWSITSVMREKTSSIEPVPLTEAYLPRAA